MLNELWNSTIQRNGKSHVLTFLFVADLVPRSVWFLILKHMIKKVVRCYFWINVYFAELNNIYSDHIMQYKLNALINILNII